MQPVTVFLDASAMKHAIYSRVRTVTTPKKLRWGPEEVTVQISHTEDFDPRERLENPVQRSEAILLGRVADLAHSGRIRLITGVEAYEELLGLREIDGPSFFEGLRVEMVESPLRHSRILNEAFRNHRSLQLEFLKSIDAPRFMEMRRAFGALNSDAKRLRNLLADTFHVWTADEAGADFLLTMDGRLCRMVRGQPQLRLRTRVVQPSELLAAVPNPPLRWRLMRLSQGIRRSRRR